MDDYIPIAVAEKMLFEDNSPNIVGGSDGMISGFHLNNKSTSDAPPPK